MNELKELFIKYPSLRNHTNINLRKMKAEDLNKEYIGTEKLHGTNASIYVYPDGSYQLAGRNVFVTADDKSHMVRLMEDDVDMDYFVSKGLEVLKSNTDFKFVIFVGEYFGKGIFKMKYSQTLEGIKEFRVFNIYGYKFTHDIQTIDGIETANELTKLSFDEVVNLLDNKYLVPYEFRGSLLEVLKLSNTDLDSKFGGLREGYVLQPSERMDFNTSTSYALKGIKVKSEEFKEKSNGKVQKQRPKKSSEEIILGKVSSTVEKELLEELFTYITMPRLDNVISHGDIPEISNEYISLMATKLLEDVVKEFEYTEKFTKELVEKLIKRVTLLAINLVKDRIVIEYSNEVL